MKQRKKFPLAWKIGLLAILPLSVSALLVGRFGFRLAISELEKHEIVDLRDETKLNADELRSNIATLREDVLTLAQHPLVREIVRRRATCTSEQQFRDALDEDQLRDRLLAVFKRTCRLDGSTAMNDAAEDKSSVKPYVQVQLIGASDDGRELVRLQWNEKDGKLFAVEHRDPDFCTGRTEYFTKTRQLADRLLAESPSIREPRDGSRDKPGRANQDQHQPELFISDVELTAEGREGRARVPVMRAATPLLTWRDEPEFFGMVVITLDFNRATRDLVHSARHLVYLTDDRGGLLYHPSSNDVQDELNGAVASAQPDEQPQTRQFKDEFLKDIVDGQTWVRNLNFFANSAARDPARAARQHWENDGERIPPVAFGQDSDASPPTFKLSSDSFHLAKFVFLETDSDDTSTKLQERLNTLRAEYETEHSTRSARRVAFRAPVRAIMRGSEFHVRAASAEDLKAVRSALTTIPGVQEVYDHADCREFVGHFYRIYFDPGNPGRFLGLMKAFSREELEADVRATNITAWLYGTLIAFVLALITLGVAEWFITRRLVKITLAAGQIGEGDFDVPLPTKSSDEIGDLARTLKHMTVQVRDREARLRSVVDTAAEGIITVDEQGLIRGFNRAAERLFKIDQAAAIGATIDGLLSLPDGRPVSQSEAFKFDRDEEDSFSGMIASADDLVGRRGDGQTFDAELSVSRVRLEQLYFTVIVRDITERKRASERLQQEVERATADLQAALKDLQKAQQARDFFLASVSHELRSPLTSVIGYTERLLKKGLEGDQRDNAERIASNGRRLFRLVEDILLYQKIVMGEIPLSLAEFDLRPVIHELVQAFAAQSAAGVEVRDCVEAPSLPMFSDRERLEQVLSNLLSNACKFTSSGRITVRATRSVRTDGDWVEIEVIDTGRGMTDEQQRELFKPFVKILDRKDNPDSTGLGLVICEGICQVLGGAVTVTSQLGKGSTFRFEVPMQLPGQPDAPPTTPVRKGRDERTVTPPGGDKPESSRDATEPRPAGAVQVLVIDDECDVCDLIRDYLSDRGFSVSTATDGKTALEMAKRLRPDIITLDVCMPTPDGWEILVRLKNDPATAHIPVIIVTILEDQSKGFTLGAADFVTKPLDWTKFVKAIEKFRPLHTPAVVLVVEDDPDERALWVARFSDRQWRVLEAENGRIAMQILEKQLPDLILLDLMMPEMDGFEVVERLRGNERWHSIPVVVVTAKDLTREEIDRLHGGVNRIVEKQTFDWEDLRDELYGLVRHHVSGCQAAAAEGLIGR